MAFVTWKNLFVAAMVAVAYFTLQSVLFPSANRPTAEEYRSGVYCLGAFDGSLPALKNSIKGRLRDPDSFELVDTTISPLSPDGIHIVEMTYRAKNGFGGYNVEIARAKVGTDCSILEMLGARQD